VQFVEVGCSVLQFVAVCSAMEEWEQLEELRHEGQSVAECCSVLQCVAVCCVLIIGGMGTARSMRGSELQPVAACCGLLQPVAVCLLIEG